MRHLYLSKFPIYLRILLPVFFLIFTSSQSFGQNKLQNPEVSIGQLIKVIPSLKNYKTPANFRPKITRIKDHIVGLNEDMEEMEYVQYTKTVQPDPVVQRFATVNQSTNNSPIPSPDAPSAITQNFDGIGYTNVAPADPSMCAGPNHIIQMINGNAGSLLKIWDRSGVQVLAQISMTNLVAGSGYSGSGDPVALYDQFSDRFMLTEFGHVGAGNAINSLIVFVSQTGNPTAGWFVYKFTDASFFPDYPHWGVWPNALYATTNDFNTAGTAFLGSSVYAINKTKMISGDATAELQRFRLNIQSAPVNISGSSQPAAGAPGMFMYYRDNDFNPIAGAADSIGILTLQPNFGTPANTVLSFSQALVTAAFKSNICGSRNCIPSASGNGYDAVSDRVMNRVYYRNFGSYESMVLCYTVDANAGTGAPAKAGIRWYELRRTGGAWSIFQQSTYAPDNDSRWMGSININSQGQIALGYNLSGTSKFASIYFTGRNATDALNTMTTAEIVAKAGNAYGTFGNRWGDYNDMATDVVNDSLFWMTAMYGNTGSSWATRITQFRIGDCNVSNSAMALTQAIAAVPETQNVVYTNTVSNTGCVSITNYLLTDTLPTNVTFISATAGGTYNAGNRVVSFPVNISAGQTQNYTFTVNINAGSYFATVTSINEPIAGSSIPPGWSATVSQGPSNWIVSNTQSHSAPNSFFAEDNPNFITDFRISTTNQVPLGTTPATFSFWHNYNTETSWDGGVVEMSTNGGGTWVDLGPYMTANGYPGAVGTGNPIAGRQAFTGSSNGWVETKLRLLPTNLNALFRFRSTSDDNTAPAGGGWYVDDILLQNIAEVNMRTSYFNASGTRLSFKDNVTTILPSGGCTGLSFTSQASSVNVCDGANANFSVVAAGTGAITYQWQVSTSGAGGPWTNLTNGSLYSNVTTAALTITGATLAMNNYQYRVVVNNSCPSTAISTPAVLNITPIPTITLQPSNTTTCAGQNVSFNVTASSTALTYQWQVSTNGGTSWANVVGANAASLILTNVTLAMNGNLYRAVLNGPCNNNLTSSPASLTVNIPVMITNQPLSRAVCDGASVSFSVTASGASITYQWQESIGGGAFQDINNGAPYSGAATAILTINPATLSLNGRQYRVVASGVPCGAVASSIATLTVNPLPVPVLTIASNSAITPYTRTGLYVTVSPPGIYSYQWYKNGVLQPNRTTSAFDATVDDLGEYTVVVTNVITGCSNTTNKVTLEASISNLLFIYPNPSTGQFVVRYYSAANSAGLVRTLNVYDAKGARVFTKLYNISRTYERMDVNLDRAASGVYLVELKDDKGVRIASGKIVVK